MDDAAFAGTFMSLASVVWGTMALSARNRLAGTVTSIEMSGPVAEVVVDVDGTEVVATITSASVERLGLAEGDEVNAVVKASNVMVEK
jgi:molybdopterin-binding protein